MSLFALGPHTAKSATASNLLASLSGFSFFFIIQLQLSKQKLRKLYIFLLFYAVFWKMYHGNICFSWLVQIAKQQIKAPHLISKT